MRLQKEQCDSVLHAIDFANKKSKGFRFNGVVGVCCGRHGVNCPCAFCNLDEGETYKNTDLAVESTMKHMKQGQKQHVIKWWTVSYDLACQWHKYWFIRQRRHPRDFQVDYLYITFVVPDFHLLGHGDKCQIPFSFNFLPGAARTSGEVVETGWARHNALASSTREMSAGARIDTLDDHWGDWNFQKTVHMVTQLLKNLHAAVEASKTHTDELNELEELFDEQKLEVAKQEYKAWDEWRVIGKGPVPKPTPFDDGSQGMALQSEAVN